MASERWGRRLVRRLGAIGVVLACGWMFWTGQALLRADLLSAGARHQVQRWVDGKEAWTMPQWLRAQQGLVDALAVTPENPALHENLAALYVLRAHRSWRVSVLRRAAMIDARRHYEHALALRPVSGRTWAGLAWALMALEEPTAAIVDAVDQALHYAPHDVGVQRLMFQVVGHHWKEAPDHLKAWYHALESVHAPPARLGHRMASDR